MAHLAVAVRARGEHEPHEHQADHEDGAVAGRRRLDRHRRHARGDAPGEEQRPQALVDLAALVVEHGEADPRPPDRHEQPERDPDGLHLRLVHHQVAELADGQDEDQVEVELDPGDPLAPVLLVLFLHPGIMPARGLGRGPARRARRSGRASSGDARWNARLTSVRSRVKPAAGSSSHSAPSPTGRPSHGALVQHAPPLLLRGAEGVQQRLERLRRRLAGDPRGDLLRVRLALGEVVRGHGPALGRGQLGDLAAGQPGALAQEPQRQMALGVGDGGGAGQLVCIVPLVVVLLS